MPLGHGQGTLIRFSRLNNLKTVLRVSVRNKFLHILFASLGNETLPEEGLLLKERKFAARGVNSFLLFKVDPCLEWSEIILPPF